VVVATGPAASVDGFAVGRTELHRERLGGLVRATLRGTVGGSDRLRARDLGVDLEPLSLQQVVVRMTTPEPAGKGADR
jgi:ABC-2 type transport system ATP-binding protein